MKAILTFLISSLLFQQSATPPFPPARGSHPPVKPDTVVRVPENSADSAFGDLLRIGLENHIPIGIIVAGSPESPLCRVPLNPSHGTVNIAELIALLKSALPQYRTTLRDGVLTVVPAEMPETTAKFLDLKVPHFQSPPAIHQSLGFALWRSIEGVLAPDAGTNFVYGMSMSAETVTGLDLTNESVGTILNRIVDKGNGGVWILYSSQLTTLSSETAMPYEIDGYIGEEMSLGSRLKCSK